MHFSKSCNIQRQSTHLNESMIVLVWRYLIREAADRDNTYYERLKI